MTHPPIEPISSGATKSYMLEHDQGASFRARLALCRGRALNAILPPGTVLDFGCGDGLLARALARYHRHIVAVDPHLENVTQARAFTKGHDVDVYESALETFEPPGGQRFDAIVAAGALEEVDDRLAMLVRCTNWLTDNGVIIAIASSSGRGHTHTGVRAQPGSQADSTDYTVDRLRADFQAAGLQVRTTGGIMFKSLPNSKMHELPPELVAAYSSLGNEVPDLAAELYVVAGRQDTGTPV